MTIHVRNTTPPVYLTCLFRLLVEAYGFIEIFAGAGWTSRVMRTRGVPTASFDLAYTDTDLKPGKQNNMDLCTSAGFAYHKFA